MLNVEKYKEEILSSFANRNKFAEARNIVYGLFWECYDIHSHSDKFNIEEMINWLFSEYQEPILDDVEKEYLSNIIKPFKKEGIKILIAKYKEAGMYYLSVSINVENDFENELCFPPFEEDKMYKGMEVNKRYTLEELDL